MRLLAVTKTHIQIMRIASNGINLSHKDMYQKESIAKRLL